MAYYNKTGRHLTEAHKEKLRGPRRPRTPQERQRISDGLKGKPKTEEHRNAISKAMKAHLNKKNR